MSPNWTAPYYSAAANLKFNSDFFVCEDDIIDFKNLDNRGLEHKYIFKKCDTDLVFYNHNPIGFAYILKLSYILFPFTGSQNSLILLNFCVFLLICFFIFRNSSIDNVFKYIFFFFFAINPLILKFVIFNFYYFWQIVPVFLILLYLLNIKIPYWLFFSFMLLSGLVFSFRPTLILITLALFYFIFIKENKFNLTLSLLLFLLPLLLVIKPNKKNFFHTAYVGLGAYENPWDINLSDNDGYDLYFDKTGDVLNASFGGNYFDDIVITHYSQITKDAYLDHFFENPLLIFRNALLNTIQGFSLGYYNHFFVIITSLTLGLSHIILLLYYRQWKIIILILATIGTIVPYYPPIPAYIFGNYLILTFSFYKLYTLIRY